MTYPGLPAPTRCLSPPARSCQGSSSRDQEHLEVVTRRQGWLWLAPWMPNCLEVRSGDGKFIWRHIKGAVKTPHEATHCLLRWFEGDLLSFLGVSCWTEMIHHIINPQRKNTFFVSTMNYNGDRLRCWWNHVLLQVILDKNNGGRVAAAAGRNLMCKGRCQDRKKTFDVVQPCS